jgi:hypothetical protein
VSRFCCPLVSYTCIHSFTYLGTSLSLFSFTFTLLAFSLFIHRIHCALRSLLLLLNRPHHPFRGLRRHATPRLASLRCDTLSSWSRAYPLLGLRLLQASLPQAHPPTAYTHSLIHSFTYYSYDHRHSPGEEHEQTGIPRPGAFAFPAQHPTSP